MPSNWPGGCRKIHVASAKRNIRRLILLGEFGPPFLTFARSCKARGIAPYLLETTRREPRWRRYSSSLAGGDAIVPDIIDTPDGIRELHDYAAAVKAEAVVTLSDHNLLWLARNRGEFEPDCRLLVPSVESLELLASKKKQLDLARNVGFEVLPTWYLSGVDDCSAIPVRQFPVCLRPTDDRSVEPTFKVKVAHSLEELRDLLGELRFLETPVVAQPFMQLPNLVVHGVRSDAGEILAMQGFLVRRKFEGLALSFERVELPDDLDRHCRAFAHAADVTGCFHYDLLASKSEDRCYYLEINARLGGTTEKAFRLGFDEPALALAAFGLEGPTEPPPRRTHCTRTVNKRAVIKHIVYALRGRLSELDHPPVGPLKHLWLSCCEFLFVRDSVFDWSDLRGSLWFHLRMP